MLRELHISNLALIEDARIELSPGLNCFTGQTGAGKSLVLGAFELLLGLRQVTPSQVLRPGAEEARVSGVFELHDAELRRRVAEAADLPGAQAAGELLITRKLFATGRSSVSINNQPATSAIVRGVGELLVDVHGQHDHQYLLRPGNQLAILDSFGDLTEKREAYRELFDQVRRLEARRAELRASSSLRTQQRDLFEFQLQELDAAKLSAGEYHELRSRHALLSNLQRIRRDAAAAHAALHESEGSITDRLQSVAHLLSDLAELDEQLKPLAEQVRAAAAATQDGAFELGRYVDRLDVDPNELAEVEDRLNTLNRLIAKYERSGAILAGASDPAAALLDYRDRVDRDLRALLGSDEQQGALDSQISQARTQLELAGRKLSTQRRAAAAKLKPLVEAQLKDLGMAEAEMAVEFAPPADAASGLEQVEMMVRTNPGQPARPLRKIASGGELSRIMLALESILAAGDRVSVLVFDEIDANVGGRMGTVIGGKLKSLSSGPVGHQVLCITHLPQIAVYADRHLRIAKSVAGQGAKKQTRTTVTQLTGKERLEELAEMLAGKSVSDTTRKQVREMLQSAGA